MFARPSIRPVAISVSYKKGTLTLTNNAIPKVGVAIDDDAKSWISVQKKKLNPGLPKPLATENNNDIVLAFKANDTLFKRKGTVTIAAKLDRRTTLSVKLAITQKVHPNVTKVETIMKDFYEALDARNWRKPWIPGETLPGVNFRVSKARYLKASEIWAALSKVYSSTTSPGFAAPYRHPSANSSTLKG